METPVAQPSIDGTVIFPTDAVAQLFNWFQLTVQANAPIIIGVLGVTVGILFMVAFFNKSTDRIHRDSFAEGSYWEDYRK